MKHYTHISSEERDIIAHMHSQKKTISDIARALGRNKGSISRELKRNSSAEYDCYMGHRAQQRAEQRAEISFRHPRLRNSKIRDYVISNLLKKNWSPEIISAMLPREHPGLSISIEAIYQFIYAQDTLVRNELIGHLRHSHRNRRPKGRANRKHTTRIPNRISIDERPASVMTRGEFGHWETDSLISRKSAMSLNSLTERKSRLLFLSRLDSKTAENTSTTIIRRLKQLPLSARRTITSDNGTEFANHEHITDALHIKYFFAHPYTAWERGTNENINGLVRWYLPKGTDFSKLTNEQISAIELEINERPRKCLGFKTPIEVARSCVALQY